MLRTQLLWSAVGCLIRAAMMSGSRDGDPGSSEPIPGTYTRGPARGGQGRQVARDFAAAAQVRRRGWWLRPRHLCTSCGGCIRGEGTQRIAFEMAQQGVVGVPSRAAVHRVLVRNAMVTPQAQRHKPK